MHIKVSKHGDTIISVFQDMQIKVSKHVDTNGKIYLPYLHDWKYPNSDLIGMIQVRILIRGKIYLLAVFRIRPVSARIRILPLK